MSKYSSNNFIKSASFALRGLRLIIKSQKNFRRQLFFGIIILFFAALLRFNYIEFCITIIAIALVLLAEMLNSVIEFTIDSYTKNKYSKLVEMAKDMAAGTVLTATIVSTILGCILFGHKFVLLFV